MLVWLEPLDDGAPQTRAGALCRRHADSLTAPRGWWLDDRREALPRLFASASDAPAGASPARPGDARRGLRRRRAGDETNELPFPVPPDHDDGFGRAVEDRPPVSGREDDPDAATDPTPWVPSFDRDDDLGGLLDARGPLLSRAFGTRQGRGARG